MPRILSSFIAMLLVVGSVQAQDRRPDGPRSQDLESPQHEKEARESAIAELKPCDVLGVFAHPDDETFAAGTFAKLSAIGKRVQLVYAASGGGGGDRTGRGLRGDALAKERELEMRNAARALGLRTKPLFLNYPGGQVYDYREQVLHNIQSVIKKTTPNVVMTFGPDGYYGHVDHVAVGQITGRAFDDSGEPSHLLHVALSHSTNTLIMQLGGGNGYKPVADKFITYQVDIREHIGNKVAAMESHKTQFDKRTVSQFRQLAILTGKEEFVEARHPGEAGLLSELFSK